MLQVFLARKTYAKGRNHRLVTWKEEYMEILKCAETSEESSFFLLLDQLLGSFFLSSSNRKERQGDKPQGIRECRGASREEGQSRSRVLARKSVPTEDRYNMPSVNQILSSRDHTGRGNTWRRISETCLPTTSCVEREIHLRWLGQHPRRPFYLDYSKVISNLCIG